MGLRVSFPIRAAMTFDFRFRSNYHHVFVCLIQNATSLWSILFQSPCFVFMIDSEGVFIFVMSRKNIRISGKNATQAKTTFAKNDLSIRRDEKMHCIADSVWIEMTELNFNWMERGSEPRCLRSIIFDWCLDTINKLFVCKQSLCFFDWYRVDVWHMIFLLNCEIGKKSMRLHYIVEFNGHLNLPFVQKSN